MQWLVYVFQLILAVGSLFILSTLLKKNRFYLGNQFLSTYFGFVALYVFFIFLYKVLDSAALMEYSIRISFSSLIIAVLLMYLTIEVLTHSTEVFKAHFARYVIWIVLGLAVIGMMVFMDWLNITGSDISTLDYDDIVFYPFAGYIAFMLIFSMIKLYLYGIRKSEGEVRVYLWFFFIGLAFMILGLVTEALGAIFEGLEVLFDILLFSCLSLGVVFMAISLLRKRNS
jgi:hypothetical protein